MIGIPVDGDPFVVCPKFEIERIVAATDIKQIFPFDDEDGPSNAVRDMLASRKKEIIGTEYRYMRLMEYNLLKKCIGDTKIVDAGSIFDDMRSKKDTMEIAVMQQAAQIADEAVALGLQSIHPGVTENSVAKVVEEYLLSHDVAGSLSVASGPRSAIPHAHSTDRKIDNGDVVWLDIVVKYQSYTADITRTCFAGTADAELIEVFAIVHEAQRIARKLARPGMSGAEVDALCRDYITKHGYGEFFIHRTGHGIGLEVHEEPYIVRSNHTPLEENMIFTIEPGIYVPGKGGVRIEDDMILTEDGARSLTKYERNFVQT
jgi:Xaa-Pro aminopeptidase